VEAEIGRFIASAIPPDSIRGMRICCWWPARVSASARWQVRMRPILRKLKATSLGDARKTARKIGDPRPHVEPLARWAAAAPARPAGRGWMPFKVGRVVIGAHHNRRMLIRD